MPVCSVAPSGMKAAACSAIARSASVGGGSCEREGRLVGLDQQVDLVRVEGVEVVGRQAERRREALRDLDDAEAIGVLARAAQLRDRGAGVQREAAPAVGVGRRRGGRHHPRALLLQQRREAAKVGGGEGDVGSLVAQRALDRAVEAREVVHAGMLEDLRVDEQQRAVDAQLLPVVALAQRVEQRPRLARSQRDADACRGPRPGPRPRRGSAVSAIAGPYPAVV